MLGKNDQEVKQALQKTSKSFFKGQGRGVEGTVENIENFYAIAKKYHIFYFSLSV